MATIELSKAPAFTVIDPDGNRTRCELHEFPFRMVVRLEIISPFAMAISFWKICTAVTASM